MKTKQLIRTMAVVLIALLAGTSPTWAWDYQDTFTDDGGEQCTFRYSGTNMTYSGKSLGASDIRGFRTKVKFDNLNGTYYWEFHLRVCFKSICDKSNTDRLNTSVKGTMYVITDDDMPHKLCDYSKSKGSDKVVVSNENLDYGRVIVSDETRNGWIELKMVPCDMLLKEGFKRVRFTNDRLIYTDNSSWGPFEYEKETGTNYTPMPDPTFSWDADGKVRITALGVPNGVDHSDCLLQFYSYNIYAYNNNFRTGEQFLGAGSLEVGDETITKKNGNRVDVASFYTIDKKYAYTFPLQFYPNEFTRVKPIPELLDEVWEQESEPFLIAPYTHPDELTTTFDQWNQAVKVQWTYVKSVSIPTATDHNDNIDCRTDGKWYLLRREKSKEAYTLLYTYDSTQKRFSFTDDECAIDKEYVYRVVFLPDVLVASYGDNPIDLPFSNLWAEQSVSAVPEVPIRLSQNRADESGVALYWEYNILDPDAKFSIQRTTPGGSSWTTIARDIAVNVGQPYATYVDLTVSSPCEFYSYRVVAQTLGREFTSNVIEGNLPAGSRITAVEASKGTEEHNVIIKWHVQQRGTDDTWFSIRRRILGSDDDWTEIGTNHGTASEYTFIDDRVMDGSYYDYAVIAYSKECDEQPTQSDIMTASGFSQARGTITGHISYGTGTAVRDVRVNLVKSTESEEDDVQQYLSRYIEGEGKGLCWTADSARYASILNNGKALTLQLWAQPANGNDSKMELARLNNAVELGLRRADDTTPFTYQYVDLGHLRNLEPSEITARASGGSPGISGVSESHTKLYDGKLDTKMCSQMTETGAYSSMRTGKNVYVSSYILTTANDAAQYPDRNPRSWTIKARTATGNEWITIATVVDDNRLEGKNNAAYEYDLDLPGYYMYYEIVFQSTQGADIVQLAELTYKTMEDIVVTKTIDNVTVVNGNADGSSASEGNPYHLYAIDLSKPDYAVTEFPGLTFSDHDFTHVTARYNDDEWTFSVGNDTLSAASFKTSYTWNACKADVNPATKALRPTLSFGGNNRLIGSAYKGYVDDVRLWNRKLSEKEIDNNYTRMLGGTENGLLLYWPLDEGLQVKEYAFDVACQDGIYMQNHPSVGVNAIPSTHVPENLKLYGLTDGQGDYIIRGIPFQQGGTNYKVIPLLGIHEFNPNTRSMFVSPTSLTANNIDFEDVSAFPMVGHVYYAGTNIPVEGIELYVDGEVVTSEGKIQKTDVNGYYNISVPIGDHYVEAKLEGHQMVAGGRFPTKGTFNFDRAWQYDFADSTLVNFVGRISGGERNDTLAVGFGASNNNIGIATVQLKLNNESFSFNCQDDHISTATTNRTWESDTTSINSRAWTGTGYDAKYVYIRTDSLTGEFSALLPPLKYITKSIRIDNNRDIEFADLPQIDLTNLKKEPQDSLKQATVNGDSIFNYYTYNTKMVRTYFAEPKLEVWQSVINGETNTPKGIFGLQAIKDFTDEFGTIDINDIWKQEDGTIKYQFGFPVYRCFDKVRIGLRGYEAYTNYDSGQPVCDTIPLSGQRLTIANEMSNEQIVMAKLKNADEMGLQPGDIYNLKSDQLALDKNGRNELSWTAGLPNIVSPYTRQFSITYERNNRTYVWNDLHAIVLGNLDAGNNFVSLGPDLVTMVLRDPPGATSKTTWKTGETKTKLRSESQGFYGNEKFTLDTSWGLYIETEVGLGISAVTSKSNVTTDLTTGFTYRVNRANQTDETWSTTTAKAVSTGSGKGYVGARGDVYIGASTNFIIGDTRKLNFFRDGSEYPFKIELRNAKSLGDSIRTTFMYSAYELEEVMIPKWKDTRRSLMTFVKTKAEAENYVNTSDRCIYATWLSKDDPNVGISDTTYIQIPPQNWDGSFMDDSVKWCNNQIEKWREVMADNEKDKVEAMKGSQYFKENISFDGGSSYSYSNRNDTTYQKKHNYSHNLGGIVKFGGTSQQVVGGVAFNVKALWDTENGWSMATTESDPDENTKNWAEFEYSFSDGNKGTDFSVNTYTSPTGWSDIFSLIGGQSYNPYEGEERTKYYEEGKHILSNGTQRMEQPDIQISIDGLIGAKSATLTDVPAGQTGQFVLHLSNNGITNQDFDFVFDLMVQEMADTLGLEVLMDGVPANGRAVFIPAGETVKKIITVRQTDQSILDYEGVEIWILSQYQPLKINDMVKLNVHFKPSSSPIDLAINDPVLNIETMERSDGNLEMKVTNFDRQFKGMKKLGVEYRYEGATTWTRPSELTFLINSADSTNADDQVLPSTGDLRLKLNMKDDISYPQGTYTFRAYTTTKYDTEFINVYSSEVTVVKDNVRPRNLTTPAPTNGIMRYGDDLIVEFNEDIVPGYVSDKNIIVTSKLNNQPVQHDVSVHLSRRGGGANTVNPIFLNGDFSADFWLKREMTSGTLLQLGIGFNLFSLGFDENHAEVYIGGSKIKSREVVPVDEWTYYALSYKAADHTLSLLAQYGTKTVMLFDNEPVPIDNAQAINYSDDNRLYLGPINAFIHDLSLFKVYRDVNEAAAKKYEAKDNYVYGLTNYWPMNEGHGTLLADTRHTHDMVLGDSWALDNTNYEIETITEEGLEADISRINTSRGDSYAIELWAAPNIGLKGGETLFETGNDSKNKLRLYFNEQKDLVLDYGEKTQTVANNDDVTPHHGFFHVALNVVRGQSASFYLNGQRTAVISETDIPPMVGATMRVAQGLMGFLDELRIWKATLSESRLLDNMYNSIDTTDIYSRGLVAYYPFEKAGTVNGVATMVPTLENMAPNGNEYPTSLTTLAQTELFQTQFPLKNAPVESRLIAKPIASERKLVIKLEEGAGIKARDVEGTTLNITVDQIHDMHGNQSDPIRWTTYVQLNTLKWMKDSVNVIKKYGDDYTFDVNIENRGGSTEYYTLYNMPQWLSLVDSERTDDLAPLSTKTLRFQINPLVPVGNYDVTIGLQGNNEILEPLRIVMKVRGEMPAWAVDPSKYENNMSIVGQIYINGSLMGNSESRLAAFIDDECRGIASPKQMRGAAYVAMSIYGNAQQEENGETTDLDKNKPITFRIWDATTGVAYTNVNVAIGGSPIETITFDPVESYGTFDMPVVFTKSNSVEQDLNLRQGWNWLSLGIEPVNTDVSVVFKDLTSWNVRIKDQITGTTYCNGTLWDGNLNDIHANTMYKLLLNRLPMSNELAQPLAIAGEQVKLSNTPVTLNKGWNWIAYLPTRTMTLGEALAGANPKVGDQVKSQTGFAYYGPYGWEGNLEALESGKGYLYLNSDTMKKSFVYPTPIAGSRAAHSDNSPLLGREAGSEAFSPVNPTDYPENMSMVIMLTDNGEPVTDAEIGAFIGDECRGAAFANVGKQSDEGNSQSSLYYLLIAGEGSGQPIEIRAALVGNIAERYGSLITICNSLSYSSDGNIGTPWEPFVIDLNDLTGIANVDANDVPGVWYTLQGIRIGTTKPAKPGIYLYRRIQDKNGQTVVVK